MKDEEKLLKDEEVPQVKPMSMYKPSESVTQAQNQLKQQLAQKPGAYQSSWQTQLDDTMGKIMNRQPFTYDMNSDALYQQYKDQYVQGGKMAMMDTMGQAATMTGGYGNSYAQGVGQQAYNQYLLGLNDKMPELVNLARSMYDAEGNALKDQYAMLGDRESQDYGKYRDQLGDWYTDLGLAQDMYESERANDYGMWSDQMALIQPQVLAMLEKGIRPSDEMLAASGLSPEYIEAMYPEKSVSGGPGLVESWYNWLDRTTPPDGALTISDVWMDVLDARDSGQSVDVQLGIIDTAYQNGIIDDTIRDDLTKSVKGADLSLNWG